MVGPYAGREMVCGTPVFSVSGHNRNDTFEFHRKGQQDSFLRKLKCGKGHAEECVTEN